MTRNRRTKPDAPSDSAGTASSERAHAGLTAEARIQAQPTWTRRLIAVLAMHAVWGGDVDPWVDNDRIDLCLPEALVDGIGESDRERIYRRASEDLRSLLPDHYEEDRPARRRVRRLRSPLPPHVLRWLNLHGALLVADTAWRSFEEDRVSRSGVSLWRRGRPSGQVELFPEFGDAPVSVSVVFRFHDGRELDLWTGTSTLQGNQRPEPIPDTLRQLLDSLELLVAYGDHSVWHVVHNLLLYAEGTLKHPVLRDDFYRRARYYLARAHLFYLHGLHDSTTLEPLLENLPELRRLLSKARSLGAERDIINQAYLYELEGYASLMAARSYPESLDVALEYLADAEEHTHRALSLAETGRELFGASRCVLNLGLIAHERVIACALSGSHDVSAVQSASDAYLRFLDYVRARHFVVIAPSRAYAGLAELTAMSTIAGTNDSDAVRTRKRLAEAHEWMVYASTTQGPADTPTLKAADSLLRTLHERAGASYESPLVAAHDLYIKGVRVLLRTRYYDLVTDEDLDGPLPPPLA